MIGAVADGFYWSTCLLCTLQFFFLVCSALQDDDKEPDTYGSFTACESQDPIARRLARRTPGRDAYGSPAALILHAVSTFNLPVRRVEGYTVSTFYP